MPKGFWNDLKKPFFVLAPMADVTDAAFRRIITKYGKPDVLWTEFVSADGLCSEGREALLHDLRFSEAEHLIVAQIFGARPAHMEQAAALARELGFDGVDINMGCPDRNIEKQGAGAAAMKDPGLAKEVIAAVQKGAGTLPVSVKTRIGYNKVEIETWIPAVLAMKPDVITVHARTRKEMSDVPARFAFVAQAVQMAKGTGTLVIGNGDVRDIAEARKKAEETGADGIMIGRGIFGNPWLFSRERDASTITLAERLEVMIEHTRLFEELEKGVKNFAIMKKHYKAYVSGFDGAKELRTKLMDAENGDEVEREVREFLKRRVAEVGSPYA